MQPFREFSSAGSEHLPYKQGVIGSSPIIPTEKPVLSGRFFYVGTPSDPPAPPGDKGMVTLARLSPLSPLSALRASEIVLSGRFFYGNLPASVRSKSVVIRHLAEPDCSGQRNRVLLTYCKSARYCSRTVGKNSVPRLLLDMILAPRSITSQGNFSHY